MYKQIADTICKAISEERATVIGMLKEISVFLNEIPDFSPTLTNKKNCLLNKCQGYIKETENE